MGTGKRQGVWQTVLLLGSLFALLLGIGWLAAGPAGAVWAALGSGALLIFGPGLPVRVVLRLHRARPLPWGRYPGLEGMVAQLSRRAGLARAPALYLVPGAQMNAFSLGSEQEPVIALTERLVEGLAPRELLGVLAHEVGHLHNRDLKLLALSGSVGRMVDTFGLLGRLLLLVNLPLWLVGGQLPWLPILLLVAAPSLSTLLQLALSRGREFEADRKAVELTGDPRGLAQALVRLESHQRWLWRRLLLPMGALRLPSFLRSHPHSEERVRRLEKLAGGDPPPSSPGPLLEFHPRPGPLALGARPPKISFYNRLMAPGGRRYTWGQMRRATLGEPGAWMV